MMNDTKIAEILLVEDEEADINLVKRAFKKSKIRNNLHIARNGQEALDYLNKKAPYEDAVLPDLVLLDINMPVLGGFDTLKAIKEVDILKRIPVVMMTTSDSEEDISLSYDLHANCYIRKPVSGEEIKKIVNGVETFWFSIVTLAKK